MILHRDGEIKIFILYVLALFSSFVREQIDILYEELVQADIGLYIFQLK